MFVATLQKISSPLTPQSEVARILVSFQHEVTVEFFSSNFKSSSPEDIANDIIAPFKTFWHIFFESYKIQPPAIKLMISRDVGVFLTRLTPYYPNQIAQSFLQAFRSFPFDEVRAPLIVATFIFISKNAVSPLHFDSFIKNATTISSASDSIQILELLTTMNQSSSDFSEYFAPMISKISFLGNDFFVSLLNCFIDKISEIKSKKNINEGFFLGRHVIRAISAVLNFNPAEFINVFISKLNENEKEDSDKNDTSIEYYLLSLFSFYFVSYENNVKFLSLKNAKILVKSAFSVLTTDGQNSQAIDDSLQVLSAIPFINIKINDNTDEVLIIYQIEKQETEGKGNKKQLEIKEVKIKYSKFEQRSSFYRLPLPLNSLKPKEGENVLISASKFHTLVKYANNNKHIKEITDIFQNVLCNKYNEHVSSAIQAISICPNIFENFDIHTIRHILFSPKKSWFHSIDVLSFINSLDIHKIDSLFSIEIIDLLIGFSLSKNSKLSKEASLAISKFVTLDNYEGVIKMIIENIQLFDTFSMEKLLPPLTKAVAMYDMPYQLSFFIMSLIEIVPYKKENFKVIELIFDFLTSIKIKYSDPLDRVIYQAYIYIVSIYEIVTGKEWGTFVSIGERLAMKKLLQTELAIRNIDIITKPTKDNKTVLRMLKHSLKFIFTVDTLQEFDFIICERCFELFPLEVSEFYIKNWEDIVLSNKDLNIIFEKIQNVTDFKVIAEWCKFFISQKKGIEKPEATINFLNKICTYFFDSKKYFNFDSEIIAIFAIFLMTDNPEDKRKDILDFLKNVELTKLCEILTHIKAKEKTAESISKEGINIFDEFSSALDLDLLKSKIIINNSDNIIGNKAIELFQIELKDKTDPNILLETAVHSGKKENIIKVLAYFKEKGDKIKVPYGRMKKELSDLISNWFLVNQNPTFSMIESIEYLPTIWREVAIGSIKTNPNQLIFELCRLKKIPKKYLLDLCSIIDIGIEFDKNKLFNFCNMLLYEAKTANRRRIAMRLFTTSMKYANFIPKQIVQSFVSELGKYDNSLPSYELTLCLQTIGNLNDCDEIPPLEFMDFTKIVRDKFYSTNPLYGNVQYVIFRFFRKPENPLLIYAYEEETNLIPYFETGFPSIFLNGLKQFDQCLLSMKDPESERFVRDVLRNLLSKVFDFIEIPFINQYFMKITKYVLSCGRYNYLTTTICQALQPTLSIPTHFSLFPDVLEWLPYGIKAISNFIDSKNLLNSLVNKSLHLFSNVHSAKSFEIAFSCLKEKLEYVKALSISLKTGDAQNDDCEENEMRSNILMDSILTFLENIENIDCYNLFHYFIEFSKLIGKGMDNSFTTMIFTQFYIRSPRFFPFYATFLYFILTNKDNEAIPIIKKSILALDENEKHQNAILLLEKNFKIEEALLLAKTEK